MASPATLNRGPWRRSRLLPAGLLALAAPLLARLLMASGAEPGETPLAAVHGFPGPLGAGRREIPSPATAGRRDLMLAAATASAVLGVPQSARAEQAWQLQLPRTWRTFSQTPPPPPGVRAPVALVVAGNPVQGGELFVLRVPLQTEGQDQTAKYGQNLVEYFSTPVGKTPKTPMSDAVEAVASSQRTQAGLVSFKLIGSPQEKIKDGRRYLKYEYESVLCQGTIVKGVNKDRCEAPEDGAELELLDRRHAITLTVTPEDTKGTPNEIQYLWVLDISAPTAAWGNLTEPITTVSESFELASEDVLEKARTVELTPNQLKVLEEMNKRGILPKDGE